MPMDSSSLKDFIKENKLFPSLEDKELNEFVDVMSVVEYKKGDVIFTMNDTPKYMFIIMSGLVKLTINGSEFKSLMPGEIFGEIGIINQAIRSGETQAAKDSSIIRIEGKKLFDSEFLNSSVALKVVRQLSANISSYLITREQATTQEIIRRGEGEFIEFKSTLRINLRTGQKDTAIEKASLKTIAAFLNSKGGTLLIGVEDDGNVLGTDTDRFPNSDKLLLHLTNLIKDKLGSIHLKFVDMHLVKIEEKNVLRVDCHSTASPAYLNFDGKEDFFIRTGPSTTSMRLSKIYAYITDRFY